MRKLRLATLEAEFVRYGKSGGMAMADGFADAQGLWFLCPKCFTGNNGPVGTHGVLVWFEGRGVPPEATPGPGRWLITGTSLETLVLTPSIHLKGEGCGWHGFITDGRAGI